MEDANKSIDPADLLHRTALVIDGHADTPQRFLDEAWEFTGPLNGGHLSLDTARQGGMGAEFFALWVEPNQWRGQYAHRTLALIDGVLQQIRRHPEALRLCTSPAEIVTAHAEKRFAILLGVEGGHALENDLSLLRIYFSLGARYLTLTWSNTNEWADSCGDLENPAVQHHGGLTAFGREVVREMNRLGMMIDISHVADATFTDVLSETKAPIIASHSSARALTAAPRNLSDAMLHTLAANGGLAMVNFFPAFIDEGWREAWNHQRPERQRTHEALAQQHGGPIPFAASNAVDRHFAQRLPRPSLGALIDHIDHIAQVAGIAHVGFGTDFDGIPALPEEIDSAADLPKITRALLHRGYTVEEMRLFLGENLLRVFTEVAAIAGG